ncbi:MAG: malonyl-ACP O-methyltransferase BioC [Desulfobulbus sp.]|jgi:malonyl-CoA O-methyltransferase
MDPGEIVPGRGPDRVGKDGRDTGLHDVPHVGCADGSCTTKRIGSAQVMIPDKERIRLRFEQAAGTYEQAAAVQHRVADRLLALLGQSVPEARPRMVLEIGCCTGLLTEKLLDHYPGIAHLTVSDLVAAFEPDIRRKMHGRSGTALTFLAGDIEAVALPERYDLIISSSTLHWVHDLPALCAKLHDHLVPGGILALSLYGERNLWEIRELTGTGLSYRPLAALQAIVGARFQLLAGTESLEREWFPDPMAVLQHLRATGVNSIGRKACWTRRQLANFVHDYADRFSGEQGVSLTYHPLFLVARA